jgi:anti-sigma factor RsiW
MRDKVQEYFDNELPAEERARFEAEMTADDRERLAALEEMRALINGTLDAQAGDVDIWSGVSRQLAKETAHRGRRRSRYFGGAGVFLAAAATFLLLVRPWHPRHASDNCDVENLEFHGAWASVIQLDDSPHRGDGNTTLIWTEDEGEED